MTPTFRRLLREPGFTITALLILALCIGANVTIFSILDAIVVRSLPFPEPERLVTLYNSYPVAGAERSASSIANYFDRRGNLAAFESVALYGGLSYTVGEAGAPDRIAGLRVTPEFFETLGVPLAKGQMFTDDELGYGPDQVAVVSDKYWRNQLGAKTDVLGTVIQMDGLPVTVIGVLPPGFRFLSSPAQIYRPLSHAPEDRGADRRHNNGANMIARLAPGVTIPEAQAQIDAFNLVQLADDPYADLSRSSGFHTIVASLHEDHIQAVKPMLLLLQGGALFLLLIGVVNLANLLLVRASGRAKELTVRRALGAGSFHVVRDVVLETLIITSIGGAIGLLFATFGKDLVALLGADQLPLGADIKFDARLAATGFLASITVGLLLAVPVAWFHMHKDLAPNLQSEGRSGTASRSTQRLRHGFIVAQVALAFVLLSGAGLLGISLKRLLQASPGFNSNGVLVGEVSLFWKNYPQAEDRIAFVNRLLPKLNSAPGVTHAAIVSGLPFNGNFNDSVVAIEGKEPAPGDSLRAHYFVPTTSGYWQAMGIPLKRGRLLEESDNTPEARVCVVDQALADLYWPDGDPVGQHVITDPTPDSNSTYTIVGVVGSVKVTGMDDPANHGTIYFPYAGFNSGQLTIVIKTPMLPVALAPLVRHTVLEIDSSLPVENLRAMQTSIDDSLIARRSPAIVAGIFAGVALILASVGTYGVLAYAVSQRRREIGVRMALGAMPGQILNQFLILGSRLLLAGIVLGAIGAWLTGRAMQRVLFEVSGFNWGVVLGTAIVMSGTVLIACLLPSQRAAHISPTEALRDD